MRTERTSETFFVVLNARGRCEEIRVWRRSLYPRIPASCPSPRRRCSAFGVERRTPHPRSDSKARVVGLVIWRELNQTHVRVHAHLLVCERRAGDGVPRSVAAGVGLLGVRVCVVNNGPPGSITGETNEVENPRAHNVGSSPWYHRRVRGSSASTLGHHSPTHSAWRGKSTRMLWIRYESESYSVRGEDRCTGTRGI